jgi:S-adenosylhomocysteine hydrolase
MTIQTTVFIETLAALDRATIISDGLYQMQQSGALLFPATINVNDFVTNTKVYPFFAPLFQFRYS